MGPWLGDFRGRVCPSCRAPRGLGLQPWKWAVAGGWEPSGSKPEQVPGTLSALDLGEGPPRRVVRT